MGRFGYLKNRKFYKHILFMILVTIIFLWIVLSFFKLYTRHGQTYIVGNYVGLTLEEVYQNPENKNFDFIIVDSIYDNVRKKQSIVSQTPLPSSFVKKHRKIYLTIVAFQPEMVDCPNLEDLTVRQANAVLETYGLQTGKIEYVPDIGNTVIRWKYKGKNLTPKEKVFKGSKIDIVVGSGQNVIPGHVPDLIGKNQDQAHSLIKAAGLNVGKEVILSKNSQKELVVVRQYPEFSNENEVEQGTEIDLWYE